MIISETYNENIEENYKQQESFYKQKELLYKQINDKTIFDNFNKLISDIKKECAKIYNKYQYILHGDKYEQVFIKIPENIKLGNYTHLEVLDSVDINTSKIVDVIAYLIEDNNRDKFSLLTRVSKNLKNYKKLSQILEYLKSEDLKADLEANKLGLL